MLKNEVLWVSDILETGHQDETLFFSDSGTNSLLNREIEAWWKEHVPPS